MDIEELELELIDAGLEEIEEEEGKVIAYGDYTNYGSLSKALDENGIEPNKATLERFPNTPVDFTEEQLVDIEKMLGKIDEDEDVQNVFTNMS
jgi:transcriptional/translational regulatory protein YebC/TACO1